MNVAIVNGEIVEIPSDQLAELRIEQADMARQMTVDGIKRMRDERSDSGGYQVAGKWFHSDQKSRSQQLGLVMLGKNLPKGIQWRTMDGTFVEMTQALAQQILATASANDAAIFASAERHMKAALGSSEPSAYDYTTGWPMTFDEYQKSIEENS